MWGTRKSETEKRKANLRLHYRAGHWCKWLVPSLADTFWGVYRGIRGMYRGIWGVYRGIRGGKRLSFAPSLLWLGVTPWSRTLAHSWAARTWMSSGLLQRLTQGSKGSPQAGGRGIWCRLGVCTVNGEQFEILWNSVRAVSWGWEVMSKISDVVCKMDMILVLKKQLTV